MILYFANRTMDILGHASTNLPEGFVIIEDLKTEEIETGVATFSCKIGFEEHNREQLEEMTDSGNYILRKNGLENEFYTIIDTEIDTKNQEIYVYAEDAGLDLLNEIAEAYEATEAHTAAWYVEKWIKDSGFEIGINEIPESSTRKLSWDGESTVTERLASIATQFDGFEVSYSFDIKGTVITNKYVNIYKKRGNDNGAKLRLNYDIDRIVIKKSVANIATALRVTGGTPENAETPITLKGYKYDDGDFWIGSDGALRSREANRKWSRYVWNKEPNKLDGYGGHIFRSYSYDTTSQATLLSHALNELKSLCEMEVNYEVDINKLPEDIKIGDRINIIDNSGGLYLSSRILLLETSVTENTQKATIGEHLIKEGGISTTVKELAAQFAEIAKEAQKATIIAEAARKTAETGAQVAQTQAEIAANAAAQAQAEAADAKAMVEVVQTKAESALTKANDAQLSAYEAEQSASDAKTTAEAAKIDAAKAAQDVAALGGQLETVEQTMQANYARKTELTETEASLQSQISQNAAQISSTAARVETIDETANNAADQAEEAKEAARVAQSKADSAAADVVTAQAVATAAQNAANAAQAEADEARTAANNAQTVADEAEENLAAAKAELQSVTSRVGATEEDIAAAEAAVVKAQNAADTAKSEAQTAAQAAAEADEAAKTAQSTADNAKTAADTAQAAAKSAQDAADAAQSAVDSLAVRVTSAETKITQNSEKIALAATKEEVATTLDGYYTKAQTDSAITVKANEITSTVSQTYTTKEEFNNLEIGGRNLAKGTSEEWVGVTVTDWSGQLVHTANDSTSYAHHYSDYGVNVGDWLTFSVDLNAINKPLAMRVDCHNVGSTSTKPNYGNYVETGQIGRSSITIQVTEEFPYFYVYVGANGSVAGNTTEQYKCFKVEKGNKATDWTPAPEDMATEAEVTELSTRVTQTESSIKSQASSIDSLGSRMSTVEQTAEGLTVSLATEYTKKTFVDTRSENQPPSWYIANYPMQTVTEFKEYSVLGIPGAYLEYFGVLETIVPWADSSGGYPKQYFKIGSKEFWRIGVSADSWGEWQDPLGSATNYLNFSASGLVVGDMTALTLGKNVLIDSDSVDIRNGNTILASFGADLIELGKNSADATISLCAGKGSISFGKASYDQTFDGLKLVSEEGLEFFSNTCISCYTKNEYSDAVFLVEPDGIDMRADSINFLSPSESYIHLEKFIALYGVTGVSIQSEGAISINASEIALGNNQKLVSADVNGVNREILRLNDGTTPTLILGDGLYNASVGATNISAGTVVRLLTSKERVILENASTTTNTAYFRPQNDAKCSLGTSSKRWYAVYASNSTIQTSDKREKENIMPLGNDLITVLSEDGKSEVVDIHSALFDRLQPVQYNFINGNKKKCFGLIAQDVLEVMRELEIGENELDLVHHDFWHDSETGETTETYGIAYTNLIALLIYEVQKLKAEVATLKTA